jgi:hypothetical protein
LAAVVAQRGLVPDTGAGGAALVPADVLVRYPVPNGLAHWYRRGFRAFRVKRGGYPRDRAAVLAKMVGRLNELPELRTVPHWLIGDTVFSLQLWGGDDLRQVLARATVEQARQVHATCLDSLAGFVAHDSELRAAGEVDGSSDLPLFPVHERYRAARANLVRLLGPVDLPEDLPRYPEYGPATLFCDPKPANFLVPPVDPALWFGTGGWPVRVDFDLMYCACPVSLQIVLALFAHPVVFHRAGTLAEQFDDLRAYAHAAAARFAVPDAEIDDMLLYHLMRNFGSAALAGETGKASALAPILGCAVARLDDRAEHTVQLLALWSSANDAREAMA